MKKTAVLYVHGRGGSGAECEHYRPLFPGCEVFGLDYKAQVPWEAGAEIRKAAEGLRAGHEGLILAANSIGAFFAMNSGADALIREAFFISPIVDMEGLILRMMAMANVTEAELRDRGVIPTDFGEELSWEYLSWVRQHPAAWTAPTHILYGSCDNLTPFEVIRSFAERHGADLAVMEGGEHWFHTAEQLRFLDDWIKNTGVVK